MDAEDVVVACEHAKSGLRGVFTSLDSDLSIVNTGEVTGTSWLVLLWLKRKRIRVHTWRWGARVVDEWLHLVEVLAGLLLEAILAIEDQLEGIDGTVNVFAVGVSGGENREHWGTREGAGDEAVGFSGESGNVGGDSWGRVGGVPGVGAVIQAEDEFLDWVVVGETLLDFRTGGDGVGTGVLDLLDEVFVTLLRKSASFLRVEIHVVGPDLESLVGDGTESGRQIEIQSDFVVLEGDQRQRQSGVAVEEKDEWQEDLVTTTDRGGHLTVVALLGFVQVELGVQTPPLLVVLVDALATDGQFNILDHALREPRVIGDGASGRLGFNVHVGNQITVAGDGNGHATVRVWGTVDGLFDVFHREVGVTLVHRLEEGNFWISGQVDILGTIGDELHEATSHCESFCTIYQENNFAKKLNLIFPGVLYNV